MSARVSAETIPLGDPRWAAATAAADVYWSPGYVETALAFDPGEAYLVRLSSGAGEVILPVIERRVPEPPAEAQAVDWVSPYGYSGPLVTAGAPRAVVAGLGALARDRGAVTAFLRCHPLEATHRLLPQAALPRRYRRTTAAVDLRRDEQALWRSLDPAHRRGVRRAQRSGLEVGWRTDGAAFSAFAALYTETMARREAAPEYRLPTSYFTRLAALLPERSGVLAAHLRGEPVAALLLLTGPRFLHYHLGGSLAEQLPLRPNNLLFWEAIRFGRHLGLEWLHLGGGMHARPDELLRFKMGFGATPFDWYKGCLILDRPAEARLSRARSADRRGAFFPAYRSPETHS